MYNNRLTNVFPNGSVDQPGIATCARQTLIGWHQKKKVIVVHCSGGTAWAGIGTTAYYPAEISIGKYESSFVNNGCLTFVNYEKLIDVPPGKAKGAEEMRDVLKTLLG